MPPVTGRQIRLTRPVLGEAELDSIRGVLETGMLAQGRLVERFEEMVRERCGARHAVATSSCTTALHLALVAHAIGPGDEVAVADFTFPATANVVAQLGARVVPVDIDTATYAMDPDDLRRRLTERTKAIIVVDPVGSPADHATIAGVARERGLLVIDDAACAIGGSSGGERIGGNAFADATCFSFHARKVITTGEGGMITTNDDRVAELCRTLRAHGGVRDGGVMRFDHAGFNYRLSDLQAAVGVVQVERLDGILADRRRLALALCRRLAPLAGEAGIQLPADPPWGPHLFQSFVIMLPERADRDAVIRRLAELGIESTIGTYAVHAEPAYGRLIGTRPGDLPASWRARRSCLTLPLHPGLDGDDLEAIATGLETALAEQGIP